MTPELAAALFVFFYMSLLFLLAQILRDNSIADIAWGPGFVGIAWILFFLYPAGILLPTILLSLWGFRLAIHLLLRKIREKKEDWRYAAWRKSWGKWFLLRSYFQVFMLQGFFMWVISLPFMQRPVESDPGLLTLIGTGIFLFGWLWESVSDYQLQQFKSKPAHRGKILQTGLWALSRHPNYFGEIVLWWGLWLLLLPHGHWYVTILSPLTITWLLSRVSGVPMLEAKYRDKPEFLAYAQKTPALIPRLKKK